MLRLKTKRELTSLVFLSFSTLCIKYICMAEKTLRDQAGRWY